MKLLALYLLAMLDGLLCGLRSSMGRCPLIRKNSYYAKALVRGAVGAQIISALALGALLLAMAFSSERNALRTALDTAAGRMLWVFVPYGALVIGNLAFRLIPSVDVRSLTSTLMLGPLTALRPLVMMVGVLYGIWGSQLLQTRVLGLFVLGLMLSLEFVLNQRAARAQNAEIRDLVARMHEANRPRELGEVGERNVEIS